MPKKVPLRSSPITADTLEDVLAGSESKVNPASLTEHSTVAAVFMNSPLKPVDASRNWNFFLIPLQFTLKEMVTGVEEPCSRSFRNVPKSRVPMLRSAYSAVPAPRSIPTLCDGIGTVQNRPSGTFPGSMDVI